MCTDELGIVVKVVFTSGVLHSAKFQPVWNFFCIRKFSSKTLNFGLEISILWNLDATLKFLAAMICFVGNWQLYVRELQLSVLSTFRTNEAAGFRIW